MWKIIKSDVLSDDYDTSTTLIEITSIDVNRQYINVTLTMIFILLSNPIGMHMLT